MFQSTHPHGVRPKIGLSTDGLTLFQSTHPHGVRPISGYAPRGKMWVSIHAPAWGATQLNNRNTEALKFQSTHPHGVRPTTSITIAIPINSFNPRTRMGCDLIHCIQSFQTGCFNPRTRMGCDFRFLVSFIVNKVSIHAPAWGATSFPRISKHRQQFQSTHPHGVRPPYTYTHVKTDLFQSTHPHGVRQR